MEKLVNVHEAKTHLSRLLDEVAQGEEVIIGKAGKPVARLVPYKGKRGPRKPGGWEGRVWLAPDFDEFDKEIEKMFRGEDE